MIWNLSESPNSDTFLSLMKTYPRAVWPPPCKHKILGLAPKTPAKTRNKINEIIFALELTNRHPSQFHSHNTGTWNSRIYSSDFNSCHASQTLNIVQTRVQDPDRYLEWVSLFKIINIGLNLIAGIIWIAFLKLWIKVQSTFASDFVVFPVVAVDELVAMIWMGLDCLVL